MKHIAGWMLMFALVAACGADEPAPEPEKPSADPDQTVGEKADNLSNYWTTIVGEMAPGEEINGAIGYPDWFHGYTLELEEGQELNFQVGASEHGYVRLYGPAVGTTYDGQPWFGGSRVREYVVPGDNVEFVYEITRSGTYMILYGPEYVWSSTYTIDVQDVGVPSCDDDSECASDEYCGDNGVRCITFPCTANYDICKPRELEGAYCENDRGCASGLACSANVCEVSQHQCNANDDCTDQFCGYDENRDRICKDYALEGERCGGFVMPQDYRICEPTFGCLAPDFIADIPGWCGTAVTVDDLMNDSASYDGSFVGLKGYIGLGLAACTEIGCPMDNVCCNRCSGAQLVYDDAADNNSGDGVRLFENGADLTCSGDECNVTETCSTPEGIYWVGGIFRADPNGGGTIEVVRKMQGF